jgi:hypothetical protein
MVNVLRYGSNHKVGQWFRTMNEEAISALSNTTRTALEKSRVSAKHNLFVMWASNENTHELYFSSDCLKYWANYTVQTEDFTDEKVASIPFLISWLSVITYHKNASICNCFTLL